jgi:hypothetical protein
MQNDLFGNFLSVQADQSEIIDKLITKVKIIIKFSI